jgi:uncharacterized protein (UPF0335 family)
MAKPTVSTESVAQDQLRAFVERIMRMREEAKAINDDIREIYAEAKGNGFDKTVLGKIVLHVERRSKDSAKMLEAQTLFDLYLDAFDGATGTQNARAHTHEKIGLAAPALSGDDRQANTKAAPVSNPVTHAADQGEGTDAPGSLADQSTAARSDVLGDEGKAGVSPAPDRTLAELEVAPPAGDQAEPGAGDATADAAPPVDTNSATHHGGSGAIPETAAAPVAEGVSPNASSVTPFLAITAGGQAIEHQGAVS